MMPSGDLARTQPTQDSFAVGDILRITKLGKQKDQLAAVIDPTWNGRVKVRMTTGSASDQIKSYSYTEVTLHAKEQGQEC